MLGRRAAWDPSAMTTPPPGNDPYQPYGQPAGQPYGQPGGQPGQPNQPHQPGQPYPPYGAYGQPVQPYGYPAPPSTNGMAIASLVVSIVSVVACAGFTGFIGAILGHVARGQIKRSNEQGAGLALGGIIVGWVGFALFIAMIVLFIALGVWAESTVDDCYTDSSGTFRCD